MSEGKHLIGKLMDEIAHMDSDNDWDPSDVSNDSRINLIEAHSMLVYLKRKLTKVAIREGYIG
ncbi:MAG: hypothetical protein DRQ46_06345 [Gammaproteobacteria bacterium]|nr:MAG: hypothetical protein DRQ46_06345 [Gammaproteobacteria bacterium]